MSRLYLYSLSPKLSEPSFWRSDWQGIHETSDNNFSEFREHFTHVDKTMKSHRSSLLVDFTKLLTIIVPLVLFPECSSVGPFTDISPSQAEEIIRTNSSSPSFTILDVRTPEEFKSEHLAGAISLNVNSPDFPNKIEQLPKSNTYIVYCRAGVRSARAMNLMKERGFTQVYNLLGGLTKWKADGHPIDTK
jgi:rhodanese-related sulfurtransferase